MEKAEKLTYRVSIEEQQMILLTIHQRTEFNRSHRSRLLAAERSGNLDSLMRLEQERIHSDRNWASFLSVLENL